MSENTTRQTQPERRVYRPHQAGLPNLREYFAEVWHRRDFAIELARTNLRASNTNTALGQMWLVINPLLLAFVYFLLVVVLTGGGAGAFPQITGGLFLFFYISGLIQACSNVVTNAGSLILNMNFPKMLLVLSIAYLNFRRFLPTMLVYVLIHIVWQLPWTLLLLFVPLVVLFGTLVGVGIGSFVATWQVYFRDTAQFLPYFIRIWLYLSPVLYSAEFFLSGRIGERVGEWVMLNPIFAILGIWSDILHGRVPQSHYFLVATLWSVVLCVSGVLYFMSREREFAVRL